MKVADLMTSDVATCQPEEPLNRAAQLMWERDCGCLPVVDAQYRPIGILTDRDICMAAYSTGQRLSDLPVIHAMSHRVVSCSASDSIEQTHDKLSEQQLHRLPVVDDNGILVGMVTLADIVQHSAGLKVTVLRKSAERVLHTLAAVTKPRAEATPEAASETPSTVEASPKILPAAKPKQKAAPKRAPTKPRTRSRSARA